MATRIRPMRPDDADAVADLTTQLGYPVDPAPQRPLGTHRGTSAIAVDPAGVRIWAVMWSDGDRDMAVATASEPEVARSFYC